MFNLNVKIRSVSGRNKTFDIQLGKQFFLFKFKTEGLFLEKQQQYMVTCTT